MFTGIVTGVGRIVARRLRRGGVRLTVEPPRRYRRFERGESVSVSGVCLTAVESGRDLIADLSSETLERSNLGSLRTGDPINLERALRWGDRLSGHFVLGHVDGVVRLLGVAPQGNSWLYRFSIPAGLGALVVTKGSVCVDGVSLTVAARGRRDFAVSVVPETRRATTLGRATTGSKSNFEADVFARYSRARALSALRGSRAG